MSLTGQLSGHTLLKEWLYTHLPLAVINNTVEDQNSVISDVNAHIRPVEPIFFPKGGMAFIYAFRWWLQPVLEEWLPRTVAWSGLKSAGTEKAFIAHFEEFSPLGAVLLAEYDSAYRMNGLVSLLEESQWYLPMSEHGGRFGATIEDVTMLYESIDGVFEDKVLSSRVVFNPSFTGSYLVGGADANMIIGGVLFDIRTTLKRRPATLTNFYQQIMYYLLDLDNVYQITHLARTRAALVGFLTEMGSEKTANSTFGIGP